MKIFCSRQENLGENGEFASIELHARGRFHSMANEDSIYVCEVRKCQNISIKILKILCCEVCKRDYQSYRKLGDHRRHYHKLPFRQERLGHEGQLSSHDLHPDTKNPLTPTEDSV